MCLWTKPYIFNRDVWYLSDRIVLCSFKYLCSLYISLSILFDEQRQRIRFFKSVLCTWFSIVICWVIPDKKMYSVHWDCVRLYSKEDILNHKMKTFTNKIKENIMPLNGGQNALNSFIFWFQLITSLFLSPLFFMPPYKYNHFVFYSHSLDKSYANLMEF